jgi:hypothetical protein
MSARSARPGRLARAAAVLCGFLLLLGGPGLATSRQPAAAIPDPETFFGFRMGTDNKLARWDRIVDYLEQVGQTSDRVRVRRLGDSTDGNPFLLVEVTSPSTIADIDRYRQLERRLYFQDGVPDAGQRDEIFAQGKLVVAVTCSIHANEVGATQMAVELVHTLATETSPRIRKILDNVILLLVPSLNPDGQIMITDWFDRNLGTPYATSPLPRLYHRYVGHDNNRDMYMFTQKESQLTAHLLWKEWFPAVWLDEHQMAATGARIFVMPATDPINPNVHPLIYRWNGILGQSQAAALEAAGKEGILHNSTYTNFWQGAMAWSGWWHNQIGLLTEVASARVAAPVVQARASDAGRDGPHGTSARQDVLAPPVDVTPRTEYPRPWMGGRWTLRDIVDYELIATMGLLETAADVRETLLRQIYEVNRGTVEGTWSEKASAIVIPYASQHDPREAVHLVEKLQAAGVDVQRASAAFDAGGRHYAAGSFVVPFAQVFGRYAKDILEKQTYPEVRRSPSATPEPPYDVTAWSLGMLFGVEHAEVGSYGAAGLRTLASAPPIESGIEGNGPVFSLDYRGPDDVKGINELLRQEARVWIEAGGDGGHAKAIVGGVSAERVRQAAAAAGMNGRSVTAAATEARGGGMRIRAPRIGLYQPFGGGNMDEGWTRWVLEQYGFEYTTLHNADIRAGGLRRDYDAIIFADQAPAQIINGSSGADVRPEYRGGIETAGVEALKAFVAGGGTLVTLGAACDMAIERFDLPVRNVKGSLPREEHYAPGTIVRVGVDTRHPIGYGMPAETSGFYNNSPFFDLAAALSARRVEVVARYPAEDIVASGWLRGEALMAGRAAVVSIESGAGRIVLFGLRPQHRAQTHATFPLLFNALYLSAADRP